jgi:hypothetical protein
MLIAPMRRTCTTYRTCALLHVDIEMKGIFHGLFVPGHGRSMQTQPITQNPCHIDRSVFATGNSGRPGGDRARVNEWNTRNNYARHV